MSDTELAKWRGYLADSLKPLATVGATSWQRMFARYQTGGRILEMREHLEHDDTDRLLAEHGITPDMERRYIARFLVEVTAYVNMSREIQREE